MKKQLIGENTTSANATGTNIASQAYQEQPLPEYMNKFRTKNSIPECFREVGTLPDRLAVTDDKTLANKVVNQSYERQKKIE